MTEPTQPRHDRPLIVTEAAISELGRFLVTKQLPDIGKFKTPSLRNVALTAPYMHDGSIAMLEEAVRAELYYRNQASNAVIALSSEEVKDLVAFLE